MSTPSESIQPQVSTKAGPAAARSFGRAANWTVGIAAAVLVLISVGGYFYHREQLSAIATEHLRLVVTGPSTLQAGVAAEYMVSTTAINGQPLAAQIEVAILGPDGKRLKATKEPADEHGRLQVAIPADLRLPSQTTLRVVAWHLERREEVEIPLTVGPIHCAAQLALDKRVKKEPASAQKNLEPGDKIEVEFYPEGGMLAVGLENRVYFVGRNLQGRPIDLSGTIVTKAHAARDRGADEEVAAVQTTFEGMGAFSFTPMAGETYRLKITNPKGIKNEPILPNASAQRDLVLTTGTGVFAADKPLEFNVRAAQAGRPLVVAAYCQGVQVGQQPLVTKAGVNPTAIPLDRTVGGAIRLIVYDYSTSPPNPIAERLVYRRPAQKSNVRMGATGPTDFYFSDEPKNGVPAAVALDLLLGIQPPPDGEVRPPSMSDNLNQIRANYEKSLADYQADRTNALNTLTTASFFGGLGLVVLVAMLGLMRIVSGMHLWIPAVGATTCCLIIGAILMDPGRPMPGQYLAVPFSSYHAPSAKPN